MGDLQTAIDGFREAAILPERWPRALDTLARELRSEGATLVSDADQQIVICSQPLAPFFPEYLRLPFADPRQRRVRPGISDGFVPDRAHFTDGELAVDPYYQDFLVPLGLGRHAVAALHEDLMISVKRGVKHGHYDGADLAALDRVLPSLRAASRTALLTWKSRFTGQLEAFERIGRGAILIDGRGRVIGFNACVRLGDGLDVRGGFLVTTCPSEQQRLSQFLGALMHTDHCGAPLDACTLRIGRRSGRRPLLIDGVSCATALRSLHSAAAALLLVTDVELHQRPQRARLVELFDLTPREAELAIELMTGISLESAAAQLHISYGNARQRLKQLFCKTSTRRQGELIALLARLR